MKETNLNLDLTAPGGWSDLKDWQLRAVFSLYEAKFNTDAIRFLLFLKFTGLKIVRKSGGVAVVDYRGRRLRVAVKDMVELSLNLSWLDTVPDFPVRISSIGKAEALDTLLRGATLADFLICDNHYNGYLMEENSSHLWEMVLRLYPGVNPRKIRPEDMFGAFFWFQSLKKVLARRYSYFFREGDPDAKVSPSQIRESMNATIRALTGGDVLREEAVLETELHRALTELNEKAKEAEEARREMQKNR